MNSPDRIETSRLVLRRPKHEDAETIFSRYASVPAVTRFLGWPRHESLEDTHSFLEFSDHEWSRWPAGPYLVESREDGVLLGSTGLAFETTRRASTGYVFAEDAWGRGYASEALRAIVDVACWAGVVRLYAYCHVDHTASWRVLEKCGFTREGVLRRHYEFPNLGDDEVHDVACYSLILL